MLDFKKTPIQIEQSKMFAGAGLNDMSYGGSRSGKTFNTVRNIVVRRLKCKSQGLIVRKHFSSVKKSIMLKTLPDVMRICFPSIEYKINNQYHFVTFPNGSRLWFGGLDNAKNAEKILGNEYSDIFFNEISELDYTSINIIKSRLAEKNALKKKLYYDMNPPKKSHWSYLTFIKKLNPVDLIPLPDPHNYNSILMNPKDNMANIDENYLSILASMTEEERKRFELGEFGDDSDGTAYYAFDMDRHVKDLGSINTPYYISMDFNVDPMTATIIQVVNDIIYAHDEIYLRHSDTYQMCDALVRKNYIGTVYPDSTGKNRKTSGKSDFQILKDRGFQIKSSHNPLQRDRVNNINRLFTHDKIIINPRCKKLIYDFNSVVWKNNKLDEGDEKMLTHSSDNFGYFAWREFPPNKLLKKTYSSQR